MSLTALIFKHTNFICLSDRAINWNYDFYWKQSVFDSFTFIWVSSFPAHRFTGMVRIFETQSCELQYSGSCVGNLFGNYFPIEDFAYCAIWTPHWRVPVLFINFKTSQFQINWTKRYNIQDWHGWRNEQLKMRPVLTQTLYSSPIIAYFFLHFLLPGHVCFTYISSILKGRNHFFTTACTSQALGIASSSAIFDNSFTASSTHSGYQPSKARLNGAGAWAPSTNSGADFLQIDLRAVHFICAVATQGNPTADEWTKNYKIKMSVNKVDWSEYKEGNSEKVCSCQLNKTSFEVE